MSCKIEIEECQPEYRPENIINGKLICTFTRQVAVRAITIELVGSEQTGWHKTVQRAIGIPVVCTGINTFLSIPNILLEEDTFNEGIYEFPFTFELPKNIPCSFSSDFGSIRYYLQAKLQKSPSVAVDEVVKVITVASLIDIEDVNSAYLTPYNEQVEKKIPPSIFLRCFPHVSGRVFTKVFMPQRAFIQGETMTINVHVVNRSDLDVRNIELVIGQVIEYRVNNPEGDTKMQHETLFSESRKKGLRNRVGDYNFHVDIPKEVVIPNFNQCKFISQSFYLQVITLLEHDELNLYAKIMIAQNIEPVTTQNSSTQQHRTNPRPSAPPITTSDAPLMDLDAPPPSYESICGEGVSTTTPIAATFIPSAPLSLTSPSAPCITLYSPTLMSMPMPTTPSCPPPVVPSSVYPPELIPTSLTDDAMSKWDNLLSAMTSITPAANKTTTVPYNLPSLSPKGSLTTPGINTPSIYANDTLYPPPVTLVRPPIGFSPVPVADRLYPPPIESIRLPIASLSPPGTTRDAVASVEAAEGLYPPPIESIRSPVASMPLPSLERLELSSIVEDSSAKVISLASGNSAAADGLYPPPIESVRAPVASIACPFGQSSVVNPLEYSGPKVTAIASCNTTASTQAADALHPLQIQSVKPSVAVKPIPSLERLPVSSTPENSGPDAISVASDINKASTQASDRLYPSPIVSIRSPVASMPLPSLERLELSNIVENSSSKVISLASGNSAAADGLYPPPIESVRAPVASIASSFGQSSVTNPLEYSVPKVTAIASCNTTASTQAADAQYPLQIQSVRPPVAVKPILSLERLPVSSTPENSGLDAISVASDINKASTQASDRLLSPPIVSSSSLSFETSAASSINEQSATGPMIVTTASNQAVEDLCSSPRDSVVPPIISTFFESSVVLNISENSAKDTTLLGSASNRGSIQASGEGSSITVDLDSGTASPEVISAAAASKDVRKAPVRKKKKLVLA